VGCGLGPSRSSWLEAIGLASVVTFLATLPALGQTPAAPARWILVYAAAPATTSHYPRYTVDDLARLVAVMDTGGRPRAWLTTGAIFLQLYAPSGRAFTNWIGGPAATGADWQAYADSLLAAAGPIARLDSALDVVARTLGPRAAPYRVAVMIPYPSVTLDTLRYDGRLYRLWDPADAGALTTAYIGHVADGFAGQRFRHVVLDGYYWLHESIEGREAAVVAAAARSVHRAGCRLVWIPFYEAPGAAEWRRQGFDEAWLQPNYFFNLNLATLRIDSAFARAGSLGMGLELEFDGRLLTDARYADRLLPYLERLGADRDRRTRSVAIYEGDGALLRLSRSPDPWHRALYRRLAQQLGAGDAAP
jgi:hypothetical protein